MAIEKIETPQDIYQLKVTLRFTNPPIWRRLLVPATLTLAQLHDVLQTAMGWDNGHMHEFRIGDRHFGTPDPEDQFMGVPPVESERVARLSNVLQKPRAKVTYTYDFGDGWEHSIVLEKRLVADPEASYPVCTDGQLACPPEDCGGIPGYYGLIEAIADPGHERHEEMTEWVGEDFNPQALSVENVNRMLSPTRRRSKTSRI
ncbi:MAG TPA: plasmid pRiA4b ORF-3 family protein [Acidobacteriaceae bacterium]